jgi:hypothetical protein
MKSFPTRAAAAQSRHVRFGRRLVEKDEAGGNESFLNLAPDPAGAGDVRSGLFCGAERLFLYVRPISTST